MKSNTERSQKEADALAAWQEPDWQTGMIGLPTTLDELARRSGALLRCRNVASAMILLRLVLAYVVCDWPLRLVGAWASIQGIAQLSDVALLYRFRHCTAWLGALIALILQQRNQYLQQLGGVRVRLVDATVISQPGSQGTDWRMHLSMDLERMCLDGLSLTDAHGGESLAWIQPRADEILIGDRAYAVARGLGHILASIARFVVRISWHNLPLKTDLGQRLHLISWLTGLTRLADRPVWVQTPTGAYRVRLIAYPLPSDKAAEARERVRKQAAKKGKPLNHHAWLAAGFVLLLTNLPAETWEASRVIWLYRLRWQIELQFKRLKSLLHFDHLRAQTPELAQTYLLGKVLAALLLDQFILHAEEQQPALFQSVHRPESIWRLTDLLWQGLRNLIVGPFSILKILWALPSLDRYLRVTHRKRNQKLAWSRAILARLCGI